MKDQYFGDENDYHKYGLLRSIIRVGDFRTLAVWMLTPDDGSPDGRFIRYLEDPVKWSQFDPNLFDQFNTRIEEFMIAFGALIFVLFCVGLILAIVFWLVRLTAQAGMIDAASRLDAGEEVTLGAALSAGWQRLLKMVGLDLVIAAIFIVFGLFMGSSVGLATIWPLSQIIAWHRLFGWFAVSLPACVFGEGIAFAADFAHTTVPLVALSISCITGLELIRLQARKSLRPNLR